MRYIVYFSTEDNIEVVGEYWTLSDALENAQYDADRYNNGDEDGDVVIRHHIEGEWAVGQSKNINSNTDSMIDAVTSELIKRGAAINGGYGYLRMNSRTIRIKDHTHSPRNGKCDVNVVIAEKDATFNRFSNAKEDLRYNSSDDLDTIIDDIICALS